MPVSSLSNVIPLLGMTDFNQDARPKGVFLSKAKGRTYTVGKRTRDKILHPPRIVPLPPLLNSNDKPPPIEYKVLPFPTNSSNAELFRNLVAKNPVPRSNTAQGT